MGFFKKVFGGIGDIVGKAAPLAALIPGVGPLAAAGIGAGGRVLGRLNDADPGRGGVGGFLGEAAKGGAWGGLGGYGLDKLSGGVDGLAGLKGIGGKLGLNSLLGGSGGFGLGDLIGGAAGAGSIYAGTQAQGRAQALQNEANQFARGRDRQLSPLRDFAVQGLTAAQPTRPDLSSTFADPTNPFR